MKYKLIACETLRNEIEKIQDANEVQTVYLSFALHNDPDKLHAQLQYEINNASEDIETTLLGYGLCSRGSIGLKAVKSRLVVPKVHDCVSIFLGSQEKRNLQFEIAPGTFYLTKGWIQSGDDPYSEYKKLCQRYLPDKAYQLEKMVINHYTRVVFIISSDADICEYRQYAKAMAKFFCLNYEETEGTNELLRKLLSGKWDDDFIVLEKGQALTYSHFGILG